MDESQSFFTSKDILDFSKDQYQLDDYIRNKDCGFITRYAQILEKRINNSKAILESLKDSNLDYSGKDSLYYRSNDDRLYFKDDKAIARFWNKKLRYKILRKLVENDSDLVQIENNFKVLESAVKLKIIDNEICLLNELLKSKGSVLSLVESAFLDAFLKYQDPNSAYFSASEKNLYETSIANSQETFGITTQKQKNGDIVISYIAPGSTASKQSELEVNDIILELKANNKTLETYCISNQTITEYINDSKNNSVLFKVKKQNGDIKSIRLKKTSVSVESNSITGYVIDGTLKIGYINIDSFYTDLESLHGLGVANDVAKQLYKLQREGIEGLVVDLRFNGGGSMKEATELTGMFVDKGPVAISSMRNYDNYTIRDPNRGTIFNKPMVILINQFSASASEFFAGALQDYNRAVLIGSTTHGKATSQSILPVNEYQNTNFIKLTMGQFYRVTGESHQETGVIPDIILPSIYDNYKSQEVFKSHTLPNSTVNVTLKHSAKPKMDLSTIKSKSEDRVNGSSAFSAIKTFNTIFVNDYVYKEGAYPLTLKYIFNDNATYKTAFNDYNKALEQSLPKLNVLNNASTKAILEYNEDDKIANEKLRKGLGQDPYIQEAYLIINDIINL